MKTHNLFCHAKIILEAEDDLFPGISSSAFDETKPKDEKETQQEDSKWLREQRNRLRDVLDTYQHHRVYIIDKLDRDNAFAYVGNNVVMNPEWVLYSSFDWFDKYAYAALTLGNRAIKKTSPLFKNLEDIVRTLDGYEKQILTIGDNLELVRTKLVNVSQARLTNRKKSK